MFNNLLLSVFSSSLNNGTKSSKILSCVLSLSQLVLLKVIFPPFTITVLVTILSFIAKVFTLAQEFKSCSWKISQKWVVSTHFVNILSKWHTTDANNAGPSLLLVPFPNSSINKRDLFVHNVNMLETCIKSIVNADWPIMELSTVDIRVNIRSIGPILQFVHGT